MSNITRTPLPGNPEILLVDKPAGITSFDVIRNLRRELGIRKMGHAGTLDPFASGLLIIATGGATKQLTAMVGLDKTYQVTWLLGRSTTTGDPEGETLEEMSKVVVDEDQIRIALEQLVGCHELAVPRYSAVKVDGQPLYRYAHRGTEPPRIPVKKMCVHDCVLNKITMLNGQMLVDCQVSVSSGAYIRTLGEEFGRRLGLPAMTTELRRTRIGEYRLPD